ncbi:MAG: GlsB/YeaQ/YmgE family stress response membrane protein [Hydrogenophaga sp.]|uniref:GlsB/YeaQ/YmgE family stress response membrane protein n=1 Tax=Hydrogenophaga sp. TaxID=1904254 RepID=UPI004037146F
MINFIIWLVVGGVIGWLASVIMHTDGQQGLFLNVIVGIVGAAVGGWIISPLVGVGTINQDIFNIGALLGALLVHGVLGWWVVHRVRQLLPSIGLPATRRRLMFKAPAPPSPGVPDEPTASTTTAAAVS